MQFCIKAEPRRSVGLLCKHSANLRPLAGWTLVSLFVPGIMVAYERLYEVTEKCDRLLC